MIDIRIMAHPSRRENVDRILSALSLPEDVVSWDDRETGGDAMYTAKKAWLAPIPENCTHRLVLQDDVEVCEGFSEIAEKVAKKTPGQIVSFFHCEKYPCDCRYKRTFFLWGCAIMIPASLVKDCWDFIEHIPEYPWYRNAGDILKHDDNSILAWAVMRNIPIINTVPALVQHLGDVSLVGITEKRVSQDYIKNPPLSGW